MFIQLFHRPVLPVIRRIPSKNRLNFGVISLELFWPMTVSLAIKLIKAVELQLFKLFLIRIRTKLCISLNWNWIKRGTWQRSRYSHKNLPSRKEIFTNNLIVKLINRKEKKKACLTKFKSLKRIIKILKNILKKLAIKEEIFASSNK